jgi:spermidine synthase
MEKDYHFDLDKDEHGVLQATWHNKYRPKKPEKKEKVRLWLQRQLRRLRRLKNIEWNFDFHEKDHGMTKYEWDMIWEFVDANIVAMSVALESLGPSITAAPSDTVSDSEEGSCPSPVIPSANGSHYDPLNFEYDDVAYELYTCDTTDAFKQTGFKLLDKTESAYQLVKFKEKAETNDVCMNLDKIIQICANYRPHYHEYMTHAAGRFVKDVRRIIFIGGGDSMLLYEALKYPNLELVVGLELDQLVTRKCFKYFNTQPHFEDPRVEWWFGDATKSLLLLPEDYWGSFDLVLVDLSETVMSLSVTDELDVFDALALLLSPTGVLVKNEVYMEKLSQVFDYTMELYYDSPVICSQCLAFGSNSVDFFHAPTYDHFTDHRVGNFLYNEMHTPETHLNLMHDFRRNLAPKEKCKIEDSATNSLQQSKTAGIIEIVNAEIVQNVVFNKDITLLLKEVAEKEGFTVLAGETYSDETLAFIMMKEGYIVARMWRDKQYIGFDINLWGFTYKVKSLKFALANAVGSSEVSSYKVVVGGMYGSSTWIEDQKIIGPKVRQLRNCKDDVVLEGSLDLDTALAVAAEELVPLTLSNGITAAVICGPEERKCTSLDVLKKHKNVKNLIPIYDCPGLEEGPVEEAYACEVKILNTLLQDIKNYGARLHLFFFDGSASYKMHQIFSSIMDEEEYREMLLNPHSIGATFSPDLKSQTWRREFLDRFRKQVHDDPVSRAEIVLQANGKAFELGVVSTNNKDANYAYEKLEKSLRDHLSDSKAHVELRKIHGGLFNYIDDFKTKEFRHDDYDNGPGLEQFGKQMPLGSQTIYQLVRSENVEGDITLSLSLIKQYLEVSSKSIQLKLDAMKEFTNVGNGGILLSISSEGNIVVAWDGREHIDINFFMFKEEKERMKKLVDSFLESTQNQLSVGLQDDQPRGTNRVINFMSDIEKSA